MSENGGQPPKKIKTVDLAKLLGEDSATGRLQKQMKALDPLANSGLRDYLNWMDSVRAALGPSTAIQAMMESHRAAIDATRLLPDTSAILGIADAARLANSFRLLEASGFGSADAYRMSEIARTGALGEVHRSIMGSFGAGSLANMIGSQSALAALAPSFDIIKTDIFAGILDGVREHQVALGSAISAYMDQHRAQAERISGMVNALAIPRIDLASFGIGSALTLGDTDAFRVAGLASNYADQYRSVFGAVNERIGALANIGAAANTFAFQQDLVGGIGSLLERALAQQEALLEEQRRLSEQAEDAQAKAPSRLLRQLHIIAAIVTILQFFIVIALQIEAQMSGGDPAVQANTVAIKENTNALGQMRQSFDALAGQLERVQAIHEDTAEEGRAADVAITEILREIADSLTKETDGEDDAP